MLSFIRNIPMSHTNKNTLTEAERARLLREAMGVYGD